jgi:Domain of unknown function (DUF4260)
MKTLLNLEDLAKGLAAYWFTIYLGFPWWLFFAWFLAPDLSMVGYLVNTRVGAYFYNLAHHQGTGMVVLMTGVLLTRPDLMFAGALLFGHSAIDRIFGYGLKYTDDFKHTHLGWIGKEAKP